MGYGELKGFKDNFSYMTNIIRIKTAETTLYSKTVTITDEDGNTIKTATLDATGKATVFTDYSGLLCITATDGTDTAKKYVKITQFGTYNVALNFSIIFGYKIAINDSNPATRVSPIEGCDNENYANAAMNYTTGAFSYGDWENAFFQPKPCMLLYTGAVDYYLDPDDYTKKADGVTASDIAKSTYAGNAMMQFPTVYFYRSQDNDNMYVYVSNRKVNGSYEAYAHHDKNGAIMPYTYLPIYSGSTISSQLRSLSGQACTNSLTAATEMTYAKNNGTDWYIDMVADRFMVNDLLVLMAMSTDLETVYGNGNTNGSSSAATLLTTGTMNTKGPFWGTTGTTAGVKVFGMENWWGNQWRRTAGWINASGTQKLKLTIGTEDGSTVSGFNESGSGYISISGATPAGTNGGYINKAQMTQYGMLPTTASGSSSTYFCDGMYFNNSQTDYALCGGLGSAGLICGPFTVALNDSSSSAHWNYGACPSCKPTVS